MFPVCVRVVTTAGNKHISSLHTAFILFPVQKSLLPQDAAWRLIFLTCWSNSEGRIGEGSFTARFTSFRMFHFCSNCSHHSQHYLADSELFCKVVPGQLWPSTSAISHLHQQEITIRWQSTNAFLRCGLLVAGEGWVSELSVSELPGLCRSRTD